MNRRILMLAPRPLVAAATLLLVAPMTVEAATLLKSVSFNYGTNTSTAALPSDLPPGLSVSDITAVTHPDGDDPINGRYVRMFDNSTASGYAQFSEFFDFSDLGPAFIDSIRVTIHYAHVDSAPVDNGLPNFPDDDTGENWYVRISGGIGATGGDGDLNDDFYKSVPGVGAGLSSDTGVMTFDLSAADDLTAISDRPDDSSVPVRNSAFRTSVANQGLRLRFREESGGPDGADIMWLDMATVQVYGSFAAAPAPVPLPASGLLLVGAVGSVAAWKRRTQRRLVS